MTCTSIKHNRYVVSYINPIITTNCKSVCDLKQNCLFSSYQTCEEQYEENKIQSYCDFRICCIYVGHSVIIFFFFWNI